MPLNIKNPEADRLARELAGLTGQSMTDAVVAALREQIDRERRRRGPGMIERLQRLRAETSSLPVHDDRTREEIIGYDARGLPA